MKNARGFTLIEIIVALGLFSIVVVLVSGVFLSLTGARGVARQKEDLRSELRFLLDTLGREMTWTVAVDCTALPTCTTETLTFVGRVRSDVPEKEITYRYDAAAKTVYKKEQKSFGVCASRPVSSVCEQQVLSDAVKVESFKFIVANNEDEVSQVYVTVALRGYLDFKGVREEFSVSSSFTPRFIQSQQVLATGPITPIISVAAQACTYDGNNDGFGDRYRAIVKWIDDGRHWMHIERCAGSGCIGPWTFVGEVDSTKFWIYSDYHDVTPTFPPPPPNRTFRYRLTLHDHTTGQFSAVPAISNDVIIKDPSTVCPPPCITCPKTTKPTIPGGGGGNSEGNKSGEGGEL